MEMKPGVNISMIIKRYQHRPRADRTERVLANKAEEMLNANETICPRWPLHPMAPCYE